MNHRECGNLFRAGKKLLEASGLVRYCNDSFFCNSDEAGLEAFWGASFDQEFGRYMAWVWFSVGAENLVKAALVCNRLLEQKKGNSRYPFYWHGADRLHWVDEVLDTSAMQVEGMGNWETSGDASSTSCPRSVGSQSTKAKS